MANGWIYYFEGGLIFVYFKKHDCYFCGGKLKIIKDSKIINYKSPEAEYYDFSIGSDGHAIGDVVFSHKLFKCDKCQKEIEFITQKSIVQSLNYEKKLINKLEKVCKKSNKNFKIILERRNADSVIEKIELVDEYSSIIKITGDNEYNLSIHCITTKRKKKNGNVLLLKKASGIKRNLNKFKKSL